MLNVNTIEFGGHKVVINSYSDHPALTKSMEYQAKAFAQKYPNAIVKTERMSEADTIALVAHGRANNITPHKVGAASNGEVE